MTLTVDRVTVCCSPVLFWLGGHKVCQTVVYMYINIANVVADDVNDSFDLTLSNISIVHGFFFKSLGSARNNKCNFVPLIIQVVSFKKQSVHSYLITGVYFVNSGNYA